jgi:hypothetical protein
MVRIANTFIIVWQIQINIYICCEIWIRMRLADKNLDTGVKSTLFIFKDKYYTIKNDLKMLIIFLREKNTTLNDK